MSILKSFTLFFILVAVFQFVSAQAQETSAAKLPVIKLEQDYHGVDVTSGSYVIKSPFHIQSPAASKLGITSNFNGRSFGFSLNTYFRDETYMYGGGNPTIRELTVVFEGRSFFFRCAGASDCTDLSFSSDGSKLTRLSARQSSPVSGEDRYRFTYRDGTTVDFFDPVYSALPYCGDDDGCNGALYSAYAYASIIKYPTGEKLTFSPLSTQGYDSDGSYRVSTEIKSNLGYSLRFATKMPTNYVAPTKAGLFWTRQIVAMDEDIKITLKESNSDVIGIQSKRIFEQVTTPPSLVLKTFQEIDSLGRVSTWGFTTNWAVGCMYPNLDIMQTMVTKETSPGGVVTDIEYYSTVNKALNIWQVKSVKRGGRTWNYAYDEAGRPGVTSTDYYGGKRTSLPSYWTNPLSQASGCPPLIPGAPTKYTDELGRVTDVRLESNSNEIDEITYSGGNGYVYQRDIRSNITSVFSKPKNGGSPVLTYKADYTNTCINTLICNKPNWTEDSKGNRTNFTYYETHGGVKSKTLPPNREGVYGREFYYYEALDTGDGTIYRLNRLDACGLGAAQLSATSCPLNADTKVKLTSYWNKTYLPQTVTLRDGLGNNSTVTTYGYNALGLVTSQDGPRNDVDDISYRTYDVVGRLIFEISPDPDGACLGNGQGCRSRQMVKHYYNNDNQEVRTEIGDGNLTNGADFVWSSAKKMTYDNAGLLIKTEVVVP